uniref:Uncharacterized protein n=1 Tax=Rhizophagus irregularis (strain DAOM 181602 / DAOM 197198 / MUCL 43194) TaxID=747089 RepID=U9U4S2_RHIID
MSSSFSQLLRNSRLSKFDPKLSQVYKTYGEYQKLGDYGVKRLTYSHNNPGINFEVQGRVLNKDSNGIFAIGISGLVGSLHYGKAQRRLVQVNRKKLDNFYLEKVDFDDQGRPNIRVSHSPILTYQNDFNLLDNYPGKNSLFFDSATNRVKDNEKTQEEILTRLRSLLKTSGDSTTSSDVEPSSKPSFQLVYEEMFSSNTKEEGGEKNNKNLLEILSENKESTKNNSIKVEGGEKNGKNLFEVLSENKESTKNMEFNEKNQVTKDLTGDKNSD